MGQWVPWWYNKLLLFKWMVREENCLWTRMPRRTMVNLNGRSKVREKEWQSSECEFQVLGSGRGWNRTISSFRSFLATSKLHNETQTEVRPSTEKSGSKTASGHGESWADFETTWNYQLKKKRKKETINSSGLALSHKEKN